MREFFVPIMAVTGIAAALITGKVDPAHAGEAFVKAGTLHRDCQGTNLYGTPDVQKLKCFSYIIGVSDVLQNTGRICIPRNIKVKQVGDVVALYLKIAPEDHKYSAWSVVQVALEAVWPCNQ